MESLNPMTTANETTQDFEHLSFHGAKIDQLILKKGKISLKLKKVYMHEDHINNQTNRKLCLNDCTLSFTNTTKSDAHVNIYVPEQTLKTYSSILLKPEFDIPIKDLVSIIKCEYLKKHTRFLIMGYYWVNEYNVTGWVKWEIIAAEFSFNWASAHPVGHAIPYQTEIA